MNYFIKIDILRQNTSVFNLGLVSPVFFVGVCMCAFTCAYVHMCVYIYLRLLKIDRMMTTVCNRRKAVSLVISYLLQLRNKISVLYIAADCIARFLMHTHFFQPKAQIRFPKPITLKKLCPTDIWSIVRKVPQSPKAYFGILTAVDVKYQDPEFTR